MASIEHVFVLGIDPGLTRCGFGAVRRTGNGRDFVAIAAGVIETEPSEELPVRLGILAKELDGLFEEVHPDVVVVERVFFQTNVRTAMSVAQASGLAIAAAAVRNIPVVQMTANEVKLALTGYGAATKEQVQAMVARQLGLSQPLKPADVADALALAIAHLTAAPVTAAIAKAVAR